MKRTKAQTEAIDAAVLAAFDGDEWATADNLRHAVREELRRIGAGVGPIDSTIVGARLRSLKSRGRVESRLHEDGYMNEWRKAG